MFEYFRAAPPLLTAAFLLSGCATLPTVGQESSGEPLRVEPEEVWRWNLETKKVGEEYSLREDDRGRLWLRKERDITETSLTGSTTTEWRGHQGDRLLDDEDFFRIANRLDTAAQVHAERESGVLWNRIGMALIGGGAASLAGGAALVGNDGTKGIGIGLILGGLILIPGGGYEMLRGKVRLDHQLATPALALNAADTFNASLAASRAPALPEPAPELSADAPLQIPPAATPLRSTRSKRRAAARQ